MAAEFNYFVTFGLVTKANLIATPSWNIENFPRQSDQDAAHPWTIPDMALSKRPTPVQVEVMNDGSQFFFGGFEFIWGFQFWTWGQFKHWMSLSTLGTIYSETGAYTDATVQTLESSGQYVAFQCRYQLPIEGIHYKPEEKGIAELQLRFVKGTYIT
jgi:hypothetical protein